MKVFMIGLLICLVCLYFIVGSISMRAEVIAVYCFPVGVILCIIGLFLKWDEQWYGRNTIIIENTNCLLGWFVFFCEGKKSTQILHKFDENLIEEKCSFFYTQFRVGMKSSFSHQDYIDIWHKQRDRKQYLYLEDWEGFNLHHGGFSEENKNNYFAGKND